MNFKVLKEFLKDIFVTWPKSKFSQREYEYKVLRKHLIILLTLYLINMLIIILYNDPKVGFGLIFIYYVIVSPSALMMKMNLNCLQINIFYPLF